MGIGDGGGGAGRGEGEKEVVMVVVEVVGKSKFAASADDKTVADDELAERHKEGLYLKKTTLMIHLHHLYLIQQKVLTKMTKTRQQLFAVMLSQVEAKEMTPLLAAALLCEYT